MTNTDISIQRTILIIDQYSTVEVISQGLARLNYQLKKLSIPYADEYILAIPY